MLVDVFFFNLMEEYTKFKSLAGIICFFCVYLFPAVLWSIEISKKKSTYAKVIIHIPGTTRIKDIHGNKLIG